MAIRHRARGSNVQNLVIRPKAGSHKAQTCYLVITRHGHCGHTHKVQTMCSCGSEYVTIRHMTCSYMAQNIQL